MSSSMGIQQIGSWQATTREPWMALQHAEQPLMPCRVQRDSHMAQKTLWPLFDPENELFNSEYQLLFAQF